MKNIVFRFNEGFQPYLYDCYILPEGYAPIELCKNDFFGGVICALAFLVNPQSPDVMGDMELAKHLLEIANSTNYTFTFNGLLLAAIIGICSGLFVKYLFNYIFPSPVEGEDIDE